MGFVLAVIIVVAIRIFLWLSWYGTPRRDDDLLVPFATLLELPSNSPYLIIRKLWRKEFIQFSRHKQSNGKYGLLMVFPIRAWSARYRDGLIQILEEVGIEYQVTTDEFGGFVNAKFGSDIELAQGVVQKILRNLFKFNSSKSLRIVLEQ